MRSTASSLQPAISAIEDSFESIRRREVERHHHRFNGIDRHELDRITRAITQKLLAVPLARLESIDPAGADLAGGIGHLQTLFSRPACDDGLAAQVGGDGMEDAAMENAPAARLAALQQLTQRQLELIGEDSNREGLRETPARVANALSYLTGGYSLDVHEVVGDAIFENAHQGMVLVRGIDMYSLCEHHLLPMFGRVHVAYVPDGRTIGLSKVARLVDVFARRLQVQERLTKQIADAIEEVLQPRGVAVLIDAAHMCMMMRGVEKQRSSTVTTAFRGSFLDDHGSREEVFRLVRSRD